MRNSNSNISLYSVMAKKKVSTDIVSDDVESISKSSYSLKDLPGVGDATLKKLKDAGILSIRTLAMYPLSKLTNEVGLGEKTAKKLVETAQDVENMKFKSADEIWEKRKLLNRLSTSCKYLGSGLYFEHNLIPVIARSPASYYVFNLVRDEAAISLRTHY